jgi:hypothetical protein
MQRDEARTGFRRGAVSAAAAPTATEPPTVAASAATGVASVVFFEDVTAVERAA